MIRPHTLLESSLASIIWSDSAQTRRLKALLGVLLETSWWLITWHRLFFQATSGSANLTVWPISLSKTMNVKWLARFTKMSHMTCPSHSWATTPFQLLQLSSIQSVMHFSLLLLPHSLALPPQGSKELLESKTLPRHYQAMVDLLIEWTASASWVYSTTSSWLKSF